MADEPYYVAWSPDAKQAARDLAIRARDAGRHDAFRQAMVILHERLANDPEQVGELIRRQGPVVEHFAIDLSKRVVAVRRCSAAGRSGL